MSLFRLSGLAAALLALAASCGPATAGPWSAGVWSGPGTGSSTPVALAARPDGGVVLLASQSSAVPAEGRQAGLAAFGPDGELLWSRTLGVDGDERPFDLVLRPGGGLLLLASSPHEVDGQPRIGVHALDDTGAPVWSRRSVTTRDWTAARLAVSPSGRVFAAGGPEPVLGAEWLQVFELAADGSLLQARQVRLPTGGGSPRDLQAVTDELLLLTVEDRIIALDGALDLAWSRRYENGGESVRPGPLFAAAGRIGFAALGPIRFGVWPMFVEIDATGVPLTLARRSNLPVLTMDGAVDEDGRWVLFGATALDETDWRAWLQRYDPDTGELGASTLAFLDATAVALACPPGGGPVAAMEDDGMVSVGRHLREGTVSHRCRSELGWIAGVTELPLTAPMQATPVALSDLALEDGLLAEGAERPRLTCHSRPGIECAWILTDPDPPFADEPTELRLELGEAPSGVVVEWDLDGDGLVDAVGNPLVTVLPEGVQRVRAVASDPADPGLSCVQDREIAVVRRFQPAPISEAGSEPFRVLPGGRVRFEDAGAAEHALLTGPLGSWWPPGGSGAEGCLPLETAPGPAGTLEAVAELPGDHWFVVVALGPNGESGLAGTDSLGRPREDLEGWPSCPP